MPVKSWIETIERLSCVKRFSQCELAKPENVLEHSGMVALIALQIGKGLISEGYRLDLSDLLQKSLIHDLEESITGDVSKPSKYSSNELRELFSQYELSIATKIFSDSNMDSLKDKWDSSKSGCEGAIVAFADTLCAILKFHNEIVMRGNKTMLEVLSPTAFDTLLKKLEKMEACFPCSIILNEYREFCDSIELKLKGASL
jgi:5'-deoxynucleotidase YfbR-like HD superfamily hydrolase